MKADPYDIKTVFGFERQLFAPLFQRPYVWKKKEQWEPLWQDIRKLAEELLAGKKDSRPHFLGAVVLDQLRTDMDRPDARSIIDGQQRLISMQLLMEAVRDLCHGREDVLRPCRRLEKLIYNEDVNHDEDRFKVWPTNVDRAVFQAIMDTTSPDALRTRIKDACEGKRTQLAMAYEYFHRVIGEWLRLDEDGGATRCDSLVNAIRDKLRIVVIDMDEQDDAQTIFETLNARGTPLLPSDLVKNFLFQQAQEAQVDVERLHRQYWEQFDIEDSFWREEMRVGRYKRPRIDVYLRHYLSLKKGEEVPLGELFNEYRDFAGKDINKGVEWLLKDFHRYARHFKRFFSLDERDREGIFFQRLQIMEMMTIFPFLLGLYETTKDKDQHLRILEDIESFLVRRMVCRLTTKGYYRLFLDLVAASSEAGYTQATVSEFLLKQSAESAKWPDDEEFRHAWLDEPIYEALRRGRVRMVLRAIDAELHDKKTEDYYLKRSLTIEHIMPQLWEPFWPLPSMEGESGEAYAQRKQQRNRVIHTFGNLTLLTSSLNPLLSNGPFVEKKSTILHHSAINLNRFLHDAEDWDEDRIAERGQSLFTVAARIWPYPGKQTQEQPGQ